MKITTTVEIPPRRIADLMVTAIEGGIGYWCEKVELMSAYGLYQVGQDRETIGGEMIRLMGVAEEMAGTTYETMFDVAGVHRYTTRDFGRVAGTSHTDPDPRNLKLGPWYDVEEIYRDRVYNKKGNLVPELRIKVTELKSSSKENKSGVWTLRLAQMEQAFKLMQEFGTPKGYCWRDFLNENEDTVTADVWFQLAVFGEVVYG